MKMRKTVAQTGPRRLRRYCYTQRFTAPCAGIIIGGAFGKSPEPTPDAGGWALLQQHVSARVAYHDHAGVFLRQGLAGFARGVGLGLALGVGLAGGGERAAHALGFAAPAQGRAQVHNSLGVVLDAGGGGMLFRPSPQI